MKRAKIIITPQLLARALNLLDGIEVIGSEWSMEKQAIEVYLCGNGLPADYESVEGIAPRISDGLDITKAAKASG
jgi:hypothetical protein